MEDTISNTCYCPVLNSSKTMNCGRNFYSLCRLCLSDDMLNGKLLFLREKSVTLAEKIALTINIDIQFEDDFPNKICGICYEYLISVENFINKCKNSYVLLQELVSKIRKEENVSQYKAEDGYLSSESSHLQSSNDFSSNSKLIDSQNINSVVSDNDDSPFDCNDKKESYLTDINKNNGVNKIKDIPVKNDIKEPELYICDICRKPLKHKKSLENHIKRVHDEKRKRDIGVISGYGTDRRYHCVDCNYSTKYKIDLTIHRRRHTGEKPYQCKTCLKSFAQQSTLNNHMKTHSDTMYFTCPHCGKQFKYKYKYEKHKNAHTQEERYFCSICSRGLKSPKILEEHMNRHYNIKNYNCEMCGSTFVTLSEMSIHSRIHGTEKRFKCHLCEYKTFVKASLEKHVRRHTGERPFMCEVCKWKCYTKGELKVHMRTHSKEKNYACPVCTTLFKTSSALNKHVIRTHGIKYKWSENKDRRVVK